MKTPWEGYIRRFRFRENRSVIFRDMILDDIKKKQTPRVLDIGCGKGFDTSKTLQQSLAQASAVYVGIEPDLSVPLAPFFSQTYRHSFEDAPLPAASIDIAFAVMVLEHLVDPKLFWAKLASVLVDGGVFWGFTMDARHFFCYASLLSEYLGIKDYYLTRLHGKRGIERYENYPVYYRANTPSQIRADAPQFSSHEFATLSRVGQLSHYVPRYLRVFTDFIDRYAIYSGSPGTVLAMRLVK